MDILKEAALDGYYTRYALDECPDAANFNFHVHEDCEVYYFVSGNVEYLVESSAYMLERGSLLIMRPGEAHCPKILSHEPYERFAINFPMDIFDAIDPKRTLLRPYTDRALGRNNHFQLSALYKTFINMCDPSGSEYDRKLRIVTGLIEVMSAVNASYGAIQSETLPKTIADRMVMYVNTHLFEDITLSSLSEHFFLSRSQFSRIFKEATGAAPWEYITQKRLIEAKRQIDAGVHKHSAAQACGFNDYSAFYRAYKKKFGPTTHNA
ncbi:MAG: AraC family transcriptional regulator [Lachnospiraceae bacterium]|nr:AraC family transcriptional regulator [Lachnospiraceae bacterium]